MSVFKKYRKRPVIIEAVQLTPDNIKEVCEWSGSSPYVMTNDQNPWGRRGTVGIVVDTLEGKMVGSFDDWIIKGVKGEFYPCKPDVFEVTYEEAS